MKQQDDKKPSLAANYKKWLEYYSPKEELNRLFQSVLKKHRRKTTMAPLKSNAKKPKQ